MDLTFEQTNDLVNCIQEVNELNIKMNNTLVGIIKMVSNHLVRTDKDVVKEDNKPTIYHSTIYGMVFDDELDEYKEMKVLAVSVFDNKEIGVLFGTKNITLDGMTDEEILELDDWRTIFGGEISPTYTLYNICENIREYL